MYIYIYIQMLDLGRTCRASGKPNEDYKIAHFTFIASREETAKGFSA